MSEDYKGRAIILGEYIIDTGATVRAAAKVFKVSNLLLLLLKVAHFDK